MTGTSSEWSEDAPGADILDLDRYMRGTRPARRPQRNTSNSGLVVDAGAAGRLPSSSGSSATELSDKRFSHDSGLSDTSYRHVSHQPRHHRSDSVDSKTCIEPAKRRPSKGGGEAPKRRGKHGSEAARRRTSGSETARRRKSGSETARRSSESSRSFRESLERALRDQQAQIARVAQLCELQARSGASDRRSDRHLDQRSDRRKERRERPSERASEARKRDDRPSERVSEARKRDERRNGRGSGERSSSESTEFSSSSSSVDPLKRRTSECRTYKIIMSKLDELNRLFVARRPGTLPGALPGAFHRVAPGAPAPAARAHGDSSVTVSDKVVGTDSPQHTARQKPLESERNRTIIVATAAVDIPPTPRNNVVTESVVRDDREISAPASEKVMPGRFHLDDPVRLYQQAKRLEARAARRSASSSPGSRDSGRSSGSKGSDGSKRSSGSQGSNGSKGSTKGSASLCALCRCYWLVARRYVAQLSPLRE